MYRKGSRNHCYGKFSSLAKTALICSIYYSPENIKSKANILGWSDYVARGSTQEEALSNLRQVLTTRLEQAKIVPLEIPMPNAENPWVKFAGMFKDDPLFDEFVEDMAAYRRELDDEVSVHEIASEVCTLKIGEDWTV